MQPHEVADVGVQAARRVVDLGEERDRVVAGADVGVLVQLEADLLAVARRVLGELPDPRRRDGPGLGGEVVVPALREPEPQRLLLRRREGLEEAVADQRHAERGGHVEEPVAVREVLLGPLGVHDAAPRRGDRRDGEPGVRQHGGEVGQPGRLQVTDPHPGVGRVHLREPHPRDQAQLAGPLLGIGVLDRPAAGVGAAEREHRRRDRPGVGGVRRRRDGHATSPVSVRGATAGAIGAGPSSRRRRPSSAYARLR